MDTFLQLYNLIRREKKKERFDIILEPLQAVTQLALLSFCPKGSKLTISNNLLSIQAPTWGQGLWRSYNHDMKEDLFFLFNAIIRFNRFYVYLKTESDDYCDLFDLLIQLSKRGIDKLLQTYATTEQPALLHTLQLYRILLDKPINLVDMETDIGEITHHKLSKAAGVGLGTAMGLATGTGTGASTGTGTGTGTGTSLDDIFCNIRMLYTSHEYIIIYQSLLLLEKNPDKYEIYIQGITTMMTPIYDKIQKWIIDNIVY